MSRTLTTTFLRNPMLLSYIFCLSYTSYKLGNRSTGWIYMHVCVCVFKIVCRLLITHILAL